MTITNLGRVNWTVGQLASLLDCRTGGQLNSWESQMELGRVEEQVTKCHLRSAICIQLMCSDVSVL
jgi:hypothetical protein